MDPKKKQELEKFMKALPPEISEAIEAAARDTKVKPSRRPPSSALKELRGSFETNYRRESRQDSRSVAEGIDQAADAQNAGGHGQGHSGHGDQSNATPQIQLIKLTQNWKG